MVRACFSQDGGMAFAVAAVQEPDGIGRILRGRGRAASVSQMKRRQPSASSWPACGIRNSMVYYYHKLPSNIRYT